MGEDGGQIQAWKYNCIMNVYFTLIEWIGNHITEETFKIWMDFKINHYIQYEGIDSEFIANYSQGPYYACIVVTTPTR